MAWRDTTGRFTGQTLSALTLAVPPGSATLVTLGAADFASILPTGSGIPNSGNLSVLVGRLLAVVRMATSFGVAGRPWVRQNWSATGKDEDGGLMRVSLPVRVGDHGLDNNGTTGYYLGDDYGTFYAAHGYAPSLGTLRRLLSSRADGMAARLAQAVRELPRRRLRRRTPTWSRMPPTRCPPRFLQLCRVAIRQSATIEIVAD
ncbi:hypothetical protein CFB89_31135 [Burkholderia sp. AU16741]|uniref:hypothetical protein n=1 Tax=unclassified Burkholderia TaxID=2613784 RepID=UPI000B7A4132|nr:MULTISPECIES: hypothetical protein [unclassified Burkholderia]MDN7425052.1 hypothetical protein [Burkholderia sp. AU45388]OXI28678.1 hypothetical protein CFB89_31135 [Burkholderia sp. AU16741]